MYNFPKLDLSLFISLTIAEAIYLWFFYEALKNEGIPRWREFIRKYAIFITIFCSVICFILFFDNHYAIIVNDIYSMINGVFIITMVFVLFKKVSKAIKIIITGTFIMVICGLIAIIADFSKVISSNVMLYQAGVFIELILFSIAINHFYYKERLDNVAAQLAKVNLEADSLEKELTNRELAEMLAMKNRDLASKAIIISQKETIINEVADYLINLNEHNADDSLYIHKLINALQANKNNVSWKEFELYFRKIHPRFYSELITGFPNLTRNDLKLCAFIKLNLSTKQIATINGKSQNTIDVARFRLRKKMSLKNGNLTSFIASIG